MFTKAILRNYDIRSFQTPSGIADFGQAPVNLASDIYHFHDPELIPIFT